MSVDSGPVINITTSRPIKIEDQQRNQQLPNRSRVIIRRPLPESFPQKESTIHRNPEYQRNTEWRPNGGRTENPASSSFSRSPRDVLPAKLDGADDKFHQRTQEMLNDKSTDQRPSSAISKLPIEKTTPSEVTTDLATPSPSAKKKKNKPQLSVPTSAGQISSNWSGLRKSLGLKDRPRRLVKTQNVESNGEPDISTETVAMEVVIPNAVADTFVKTKSFSGLTKTVALDCEFVGIGPGARENMLARVSLVNQFGHCLYDKFVKPTELVKDYRTHVSGVRAQDLKKGEDFKVVQKEVSEILNGRILVGHAVHHDLEVLLLSHPKSDLRDTSKFKPFRQICKGGTPSLKKLTAKILGFGVQTGEHDSVQDAQATMRLYTLYKREWESKVSFKGKKLRMLQKKKPASATTANVST